MTVSLPLWVVLELIVALAWVWVGRGLDRDDFAQLFLGMVAIIAMLAIALAHFALGFP
jgi:hypothetical protein